MKMGLSLHHIRRDWETLAERDPLWAVLSHPDRQGGGWDLAAFSATGERQVADLFARFAALGLPTHYAHALDFGCGAGRLTQALGDRCDLVTGADVAAPMLELGRRFNRYPESVTYLLNDRPDLASFADGTFDLVLSLLTLQHMPPALSRGYVREMLRVLRPGGTLCIQALTHRTGLHPAGTIRSLPFGERLLHGALRLLGRPVVMMYAPPRGELVRTIERARGTVLAVDPSSEGQGWHGAVYFARMA